MLTRLYIHNYKCYQNFEFDLGKIREALIIGANGVGKSTIGHVLWILQRIGRGECQIDELIKINDAFELANNGVVRIEASFEVDSSEYTYGFSLELPSGFKKLRVADERLVYNGETVFSRERAQVVLQSAHGGESRFLLDWHELALPRIFIQEGLTPSAVMRVREIFSAILILVPNPDEVGAAVGDEAADYLDAILRALSYDGKCAEAVTRTLIEALPEICRVLKTDLLAAYVGDPAAKGVDEIILCYPAFFAIATFRLSHVLYLENVPLLPRVMTEYAHRLTGIDIHPGAAIGESFFIDHGTGVVIGETTTIGSGVKIYQHVTLGAKSFDTDSDGMPIKGVKRHPDIGDRVVIYAGATILGGETRIGNDCVIGGSVWLTHSVEAGKMVLARAAVMDSTLKRDVMHPTLPEDSAML